MTTGRIMSPTAHVPCDYMICVEQPRVRKPGADRRVLAALHVHSTATELYSYRLLIYRS